MTDKFYFTPLARWVFEVWGYTTKIAVLATNYSMEWHSMIDEQIKEPLAGWGELITNWIRSYSSTRLIGWLWTKRQYAWWTERASMHLLVHRMMQRQPVHACMQLQVKSSFLFVIDLDHLHKIISLLSFLFSDTHRMMWRPVSDVGKNFARFSTETISTPAN